MSFKPKTQDQFPEPSTTEAQAEIAHFLDGSYPDTSVNEASVAYELLSDGLREMQDRPTDSDRQFWKNNEDGSIQGNGGDVHLTDDESALTVYVDDRRFTTEKSPFSPDTSLRLSLTAIENWHVAATEPTKSSLIYFDLEHDTKTGLPGLRKKVQHWYGPTVASLKPTMESLFSKTEDMTDVELEHIVGALATEQILLDEGVDVQTDPDIEQERNNAAYEELSDELRNTKANKNLEAELGLEDKGSLVGEEEMKELIELLLSKQ